MLVHVKNLEHIHFVSDFNVEVASAITVTLGTRHVVRVDLERPVDAVRFFERTYFNRFN